MELLIAPYSRRINLAVTLDKGELLLDKGYTVLWLRWNNTMGIFPKDNQKRGLTSYTVYRSAPERDAVHFVKEWNVMGIGLAFERDIPKSKVQANLLDTLTVRTYSPKGIKVEVEIR